MVSVTCGSTQKESIMVEKPSTFMDFLLKNNVQNHSKYFVCVYTGDYMASHAKMFHKINNFQSLYKFHIYTSKMYMMGDRLDTNILFEGNVGCKILLVLTGENMSSFFPLPF